MTQPIPQKIQENNPDLIKPKQFNTLLVDGSNLLEISCIHKKLNSKGREIGGIYQFLLQLKLLLRKGNFRYVYVMWDGSNSGQLRHIYNTDYKANRDKTFSDDNLSDYMKEVEAHIKYMQQKMFNKPRKSESEKENFMWQREILIKCLDELCVRQCLYDEVEADDFIGYYVSHKLPEENIVIFSNDRDLTQLIHKSSINKDKDDVIIAIKPHKSDIRFINSRNHIDEMGYHYENVVLKKVICGDTSDNIKGIKGVGEKTLLSNFPQFLSRKVTLEEVINGASLINEERKKNKQKPLKWAENIVNRVTDGVTGNKIYEINEMIIDLKNPLMHEGAKELLDNIMYAPLDTEERNIENLYKIIIENDIDELKNEVYFSNFFIEYKFLMDKESKNL